MTDNGVDIDRSGVRAVLVPEDLLPTGAAALALPPSSEGAWKPVCRHVVAAIRIFSLVLESKSNSCRVSSTFTLMLKFKS